MVQPLKKLEFSGFVLKSNVLRESWVDVYEWEAHVTDHRNADLGSLLS